MAKDFLDFPDLSRFSGYLKGFLEAVRFISAHPGARGEPGRPISGTGTFDISANCGSENLRV